MINFVCPYCGVEIPLSDEAVSIPSVSVSDDPDVAYTVTINMGDDTAFLDALEGRR